VLEVDRVSKRRADFLVGRAQPHGTPMPGRQRAVVSSHRTVRQRNVHTTVVGHSGRREQQLGNPPPGQPETGLDVEERESSISLDTSRGQCNLIKTLTLQRLDRIPPQLDDPHDVITRPSRPPGPDRQRPQSDRHRGSKRVSLNQHPTQSR
jgi:hypothetical protein